MIRICLFLSFKCIPFLFSTMTVAYGQSLGERAASVSGESFVRAFIGNCAQNAGNFERVISASEAMGFKNLPDELAPLVSPQDPGAEFEGYFADEGEAAPYFVGVSRGDIGKESFVTCAIANPYIDTTEVVEALESFLQLRQPHHDETGMGQRYRSWLTDSWAQGSSISLMDAEPMGYRGATLSMIAPMIKFHGRINSEEASESLDSIRSLLLDQLSCSKEPSAIDIFTELHRYGYINSSEMIGIDGISCFNIEAGLEINDLIFDTVCGQETNIKTVEDFPDFLWTAPGCCPMQQLSLGTAQKENVVTEWYQKTYGIRPENVWIRSNNTTLGDETELMCINF